MLKLYTGASGVNAFLSKDKYDRINLFTPEQEALNIALNYFVHYKYCKCK